mgnify:CR=1 FL=1
MYLGHPADKPQTLIPIRAENEEQVDTVEGWERITLPPERRRLARALALAAVLPGRSAFTADATDTAKKNDRIGRALISSIRVMPR